MNDIRILVVNPIEDSFSMLNSILIWKLFYKSISKLLRRLVQKSVSDLVWTPTINSIKILVRNSASNYKVTKNQKKHLLQELLS